MDEKYRLKRVGDDWEFLPKEERDRKREYENLTVKIRRREKKIERMKVKLKEDKEELNRWKKEMRRMYNEMVKYQKELKPTFSASLSKNSKKISSDRSGGLTDTKGNRSWTLYIRIGGKTKDIFPGTMKWVGEMIDKIEGKSNYWSEKKVITNSEHRDQTKKKIENLLKPLIKRDMIKCLESEGSLDRYMNTRVKGMGMDYFKELYEKSEFYEEPEDKESEGGKDKGVKG